MWSIFPSVLLAVSLLVLQVESSPLPRRAVPVTLPLKRVQSTQNDLHPQILLQQRMNHAHRRLARMTGQIPPTDLELRDNLHRRIIALEHDGALAKRYNRIGVPKPAAKPSSNELVEGNDLVGSTDSLTAPPGVAIANVPTITDTLGLDIQGNDLGYLATVKMGTPPRDFLILMDSGSADLWVGAEGCQSAAGGDCGQHSFLGSTSSSSFRNTSKPFSVTYGTGKVSGSVVQDNLDIAGLVLTGHTFGVAQVESVEFKAPPFDGLMGLARSALSQEKTPTPVEALASAGLIPAPITSYKISRLADGKNDGEITFGGLDPAKFDPTAVATLNNVNTAGFWEANMGSVTVNGQDAGLAGRSAILDTGTTLIVAPPADAAAIHRLIPGAASDGRGGFTIPCTSTSSVALVFGGISFAIDTRDLLVQPVDINNPTGACVSGITSGQIGGNTEWLVGDVFLKNAYYSTDVARNTIVLAKLL